MHRDDEEMNPMTREERRAADALIKSLSLDAKLDATPDPNPKDGHTMKDGIFALGADAMLHGATCACGRHPLPKSVDALPPMLQLVHAMSTGMIPAGVAVRDLNDDSIHSHNACMFPDPCGCEGECEHREVKSGNVREKDAPVPRHVDDLEREAQRLLGDPRALIVAVYRGRPID